MNRKKGRREEKLFIHLWRLVENLRCCNLHVAFRRNCAFYTILGVVDTKTWTEAAACLCHGQEPSLPVASLKGKVDVESEFAFTGFGRAAFVPEYFLCVCHFLFFYRGVDFTILNTCLINSLFSYSFFYWCVNIGLFFIYI